MFLLVYASSLTGINFEKTIWNNNLFLQIYSNALLLTKILSYTYKSLTIFLLFPTFSRIKTWREREREREREGEREKERERELKPTYSNGSLFITKSREIVWKKSCRKGFVSYLY